MDASVFGRGLQMQCMSLPGVDVHSQLMLVLNKLRGALHFHIIPGDSKIGPFENIPVFCVTNLRHAQYLVVAYYSAPQIYPTDFSCKTLRQLKCTPVGVLILADDHYPSPSNNMSNLQSASVVDQFSVNGEIPRSSLIFPLHTDMVFLSIVILSQIIFASKMKAH